MRSMPDIYEFNIMIQIQTGNKHETDASAFPLVSGFQMTKEGGGAASRRRGRFKIKRKREKRKMSF